MNSKILYIQYANPACYPPLEHSSRILADKGWKVFFIGTEAFGESNTLTFKGHPNISMKRIPYHRGGWKQKLHYLWFCLLATLKTIRWHPQWIYASDPFSCPIALMLAKFFRVKVIYHEHDSPRSQYNSSNIGKLISWSRGRLAMASVLCMLPNEARINKFIEETNRAGGTLCVWNCPRKEEIRPPRQLKRESSLIIYYHGAINRDHLPDTLINAMKTLPDNIKLKVIGYETIGSTGYQTKFLDEAIRYKIEKQVEFHKPMSRHQLLEECSLCDVGLVFMPMNSADINNSYSTGASNKAFDYLACGLAVLVPDLADWRKIYVEPGYGLACDLEDPESIAKAIRYFLEHPEETRRMGERGRQKILTHWNYETQFEPVRKIICRS